MSKFVINNRRYSKFFYVKRGLQEKSNPSGGFNLREFSRCKEVSRRKIVCREQGKMEEWFALYRYKENKAGRGMMYRGGWHIVDIRNKKMEDETESSLEGGILSKNGMV